MVFLIIVIAYVIGLLYPGRHSLVTKNSYDKQTTPYYNAARLCVDAIINPLDTRKWLSMGLEMANNAPVAKYNVGVIQT